MLKIYLGDLGHYTIKLTNNHTPLGIGFIAAYCKKHLKDAVDIKLYKDPAKLADDIESKPPDILGLSNYVWCQSVSEDIFKFYRKTKKDGIAVWGGPNFPMNELHKAKQYLIDRPYIDFYIPYEGETPFLNITKAVLEHRKDAAKLKKHHGDCFGGSFFLTDQNEMIGNDIGVQIPELEEIPSPYLDGWMDSFLHEGLHAMFETQRGCPYKCAFCHTGLDYYNRGRSFSLERCIKEIHYITNTVENPANTHLYITDSNFGMWPQDLEFSKFLNEHYQKTGFPLSFGTSTGKGRVKLVLETVMSHPKLMLTNSVQSLDRKVLDTIKRRNLPLDQLKYSQVELDANGKLSQPDVILGLPNENRESHLNTLRTLVADIGANIIYQYTLMLLPGTTIYTDESRKEYEYLVKYRLLPTSFGEYKSTRSFEIEEVSVATKDLSFHDYLDMREIFFYIHNVYSNFIYRSLIRYLLYLRDDVIDFFLFLIEKRKTLGDHFANTVIEDYIQDTKDELFDSKEALTEYYSKDENYQELLKGTKGHNLTHTYRTIVLLSARPFADFVTQAFAEFLRK
ncbi:MAG: radical SAM protein, partial [Candidatus Omnitrophica bacterium]|nr:radical SAM protein [Candidatus Omnitrophota bacterium]